MYSIKCFNSEKLQQLIDADQLQCNTFAMRIVSSKPICGHKTNKYFKPSKGVFSLTILDLYFSLTKSQSKKHIIERVRTVLIQKIYTEIDHVIHIFLTVTNLLYCISMGHG